MNRISALYFAFKLYLQVRYMLYKHNIPWKYVHEELILYLMELDTFYLPKNMIHSFILFHIENTFIIEVIKTNLVYRKRFEEKLNRIIK